MSAPLVVNTKDGTCWTRRGSFRGGEALYAPEGVCKCPEFVMATLAELAEHGIVGSADALPVPVGPEPQARSILDRARDALGARMAKDALRHVLGNVIDYAARLEAERRSTNEALDDAVRALRETQDQRALPWAHTMPDDDLHGFLGDLVSAAMGRWQHSPEVPDREVLAAVEKACADWRTPGQGYRSDEPETTPSLTVFRASHDSIVMGLYTTREAARAHCVAEERRAWSASENPVFDWVEYEEDGTAELVTVDEDGELESFTGYVVTALEVAAAYDPDGDE